MVFVNNGLTGGDIERVINIVADDVRREGKFVEILSQERDLLTSCRNSLRGYSTCYGAAIFYSSPSEGPANIWNYSLRADGGLGFKIDTTKPANDVEIYPLPLQHAIDFAIASSNQTIDQSALPSQVDEYPFTDKNQKEHNDDIRIRFMGGELRSSRSLNGFTKNKDADSLPGIIDILAVAFFLGVSGVIYQLVGLMVW